MALFSKKHKCPKCKQTVQIRDKDCSHAFFCDSCRYPLFWNAGTKELEVDTLRSKKAHKNWSDRKKRQRAAMQEQESSDSSCLLTMIGLGLSALLLKKL